MYIMQCIDMELVNVHQTPGIPVKLNIKSLFYTLVYSNLLYIQNY
jgi:hypothetical protein